MVLSDSFPTSINSLHVNPSPNSLSQTLASLHLSTLSAHNRLSSIYQDSLFVQRVASHLDLPIVANERCGSWYVPPEKKASSVYFKSTDGHFGQWSFSKRRLNLHVLDIISKCEGCIIVDSTRRGKSMPDALAKTVPIWCAVINRLVFENCVPIHELHVPSDVVSASEYSQIKGKIDSFVNDAKAIIPDLACFRKSLQKPLRPLWITPESLPYKALRESVDSKFYPVVCCTASRQVSGAEVSGPSYIQGAGDDSEGWSYGLTPTIFWQHSQELIKASDQALPNLIEEFVGRDKQSYNSCGDIILVAQTNNIYLGNLSAAAKPDHFHGVIICSDGTFPKIDLEGKNKSQVQILNLNCGVGKLGSRALRAELPRIAPFISSIACHTEIPRILFACSTGKDLSVGAALVALCLFFDGSCEFMVLTPLFGPLISPENLKITSLILRELISISDKFCSDFAAKSETRIDKLLVRRRLAWITTAKPEANPSRSTLQAVNSFLMERPQ